MSRLQARMADFGFESNDDYAYQIRCLLDNQLDPIRCLYVDGDSGRRNTAFANALAQALEYPHILYHDFTQQHQDPEESILPPSRDETGRQAAPILPLDSILSEACAFSLAENSILILDQLQAADFRDQIRIYRFLHSGEWQTRDCTYHANRRHLLVVLISEEELYHSLRKSSFRVWVNRISERAVDYRAEEFGLEPDAQPMMTALGELFAGLGVTPTRSEYAKLLRDLSNSARTAEQLRHSLFGWTEGVARSRLWSDELEPLVQHVVRAIEGYLGVQEVELSTADPE